MNNAHYIGWSIVDVEDSRSRDEHGMVVPHSGDQRPCDCCGRAIDVLVTIAPVRYEMRYLAGRMERVAVIGESSAIVGMTCARKMGLTDTTKQRIKKIRPPAVTTATVE